MVALAGLADFGSAVSGDTLVAYAAHGSGAYLVLPSAGAMTAFALTMTRVSGDSSAERGYAMLDVEVGCDYPLDDALAMVRATDPTATATAIPIDIGYARLVSAGAGLALPEPVTQPVMLGYSAAAGARWSQHLDLAVGEVIKGAVQQGSLLFGVRIEFAVRGVAARAAGMVSFVPSALASQLLGFQKSITREDLIVRLSDPSKTPALQTAARRIDIAEALADRWLAAFGQFVPAADAQGYACFAMAANLPLELLDWDLSLPAAGTRAYALRLDTVSGLAALDPGTLVAEVTIPPLDLGFREVQVAANLPAPRQGAPAIGVRISTPAAPPKRPNGISQTVSFQPPDDIARASLRFDPDETFAYDLTPFAVVAGGAFAHELDAPALHQSAGFVQLQARDFQLVFAHITASPRLVAAAAIDGELTYAWQSKIGRVPFKLVHGAADVAIAMPIDATGATLSVTAKSADGTVLTAPPLAAGRISLDFPAFAEFGPRTVAVHAVFGPDDAPLTLEFEPENGVGAGSIALAPFAPDSHFAYFAASPFQAGYRFRPQGGAWSALRTPEETLNVNSQGVVMNLTEQASEQPPPPKPFELDGIDLTVDPYQPEVLRYIPAAPVPELTAAGKPTLTIVKTAQGASLQFGVHLDLPPDGAATLARQVAQAQPALASARLQPASLAVQSISVKLADSTGKGVEIGTARGSAFPPYAAVFSIQLNPAQAGQAISAVGGRTGVLSVDYTVSTPGRDSPLTRSADLAAWFSGTSGLSHVLSPAVLN
jgi:hypothetical protein